jgi:hypothetical protein
LLDARVLWRGFLRYIGGVDHQIMSKIGKF